MRGTMIAFPSPSGSTPAYLSFPETNSGPGVVVIQDWWGLTDHVRDVTDRIADAGFVALAPDLYHGEVTRSPDDARVDFYGAHSKASLDPARLQVPLLAHFGREDPIVKRGDAAALAGAPSAAGKFVDAYYYDAARHAFFNDTRPSAYNPAAAALAWDRTLAFLRDALH